MIRGDSKKNTDGDEYEVFCSGFVEQIEPSAGVKFGRGEIGDEVIIYDVLCRNGEHYNIQHRNQG